MFVYENNKTEYQFKTTNHKFMPGVLLFKSYEISILTLS